MQNLQLPTSQLFFQICQLSRKNRINDTERRALKKLVIIDNQGIFDIIKDFNEGKIDENQLQNELITLSREIDMKSDENEIRTQVVDYEFNQAEAQKVAEYIQQNPEIPEEIASPLGAQLWRRRRDQRQKQQHQRK